MHDFSDQVALVTGAGWSPGLEVALAFSARGAKVAVCDLTPVNLDEIVSRIAAQGGAADLYTADVSSKIQAQTLIASVIENWGRIDVLVNIVGVRPRAPLLDLDEWEWRRALDSNLTGPFLMTQIAGRAMRLLGGGSVIFLADTSETGGLPIAQAAFSTAQSGLAGLTCEAASELAADRIRVNALLRGAGAGRVADSSPEVKTLFAGVGSMAEAAVLLCSPQAADMTGRVIAIV